MDVVSLMDHPSLSESPTEILELIVSNIDGPQDLLSLALTSRLFHDIIIPNHIQCRQISCLPQEVDLWRFFTSNPYLALRVRHLDLSVNTALNGRKDCVPQSIPLTSSRQWYELEEEETDLLVTAISLMKAMTRFCWDFRHKTILLPLTAELPHKVFSALCNSVYALQELHIALRVFDDSFFEHILSPLSSLSTQQLTKISFCFRCEATDSQYDLRIPGIEAIILECPLLQQLHLDSWTTCVMPRILLEGNWSCLTHLSIGKDIKVYLNDSDESAKISAMNLFLTRHPSLTCLYISAPGCMIPGSIPQNCLPQLKSIYLPLDLPLSSILPMRVARCLSYFRASITEQCLPMLREMKALRSCAPLYSGHEFSELFASMPFVEAVELRPTLSTHSMDETINEWIASLGHLRCLTQLAGFTFSYDKCIIKLTYLLKQMASLHKLRLVEIMFATKNTWVKLERDETGTFSSFEPMPGSGFLFGGFFLGIL